MAITIQDYRVKISLYHATGKNLQIKFKNTTTKTYKTNHLNYHSNFNHA